MATIGRPRRMDVEVLIVNLLLQGTPIGAIAKKSGVHRNTVGRVRKQIDDMIDRTERMGHMIQPLADSLESLKVDYDKLVTMEQQLFGRMQVLERMTSAVFKAISGVEEEGGDLCGINKMKKRMVLFQEKFQREFALLQIALNVPRQSHTPKTPGPNGVPQSAPSELSSCEIGKLTRKIARPITSGTSKLPEIEQSSGERTTLRGSGRTENAGLLSTERSTTKTSGRTRSTKPSIESGLGKTSNGLGTGLSSITGQIVTND